MVTMERSVTSNTSISNLLKQTVIKFCQENYVPNSDGDLELDAIICVSTVDAQNQNVVKIHQILNQAVDNSKWNCDDLSATNGGTFQGLQELENDGEANSEELGECLPQAQEKGSVVAETPGSDEKWLRMNRLKVYKKKRKIAVQRRKQSIACKISPTKVVPTGSLNSSPPNPGYMLRVPCIASQLTSIRNTCGARNDENLNAENEVCANTDDNLTSGNLTESASENFTGAVVKVEPEDVDDVYANGDIMSEIPDTDTFQDTGREGYEEVPSQSVFPPRQSDNFYLSQNDSDNSAQNLSEQDLSHLAGLSTGALSVIESQSMGDTASPDPQVLRKRKRKQSSQNILRVSEMKVESAGDEGRKISSLLSGDSPNLEPIANHSSEPKVPKIIIRNATDASLVEKSKKQPRLVSLLTSSIPSLLGTSKQHPSRENANKKEKEISSGKKKNSVASSSMSDMADIASMQKAVSSPRVTSLLKQKLSLSKVSPGSIQQNDQTFYCSKCGSGFKSKKSKMRHEKYTCGELRTFECEMCGKFYSRADSKTRHMFRIHGIRPAVSSSHMTKINDSSYAADENQNGSPEFEPDQNDTSEGFDLEFVNDSE